jgi:signal transduction histidine kinase
MILSLHFDDRLQTLLDAPVADARDRAVRWRQLVDLLARGEASDGATHAAALELVRREAFAIDEEVRAATLRAIAGLNVPADLLAVLAAQPLRVAAALFAGLTLSEEDAAHILGGADPEVRALVRIKSAPAQQAHPATELVETRAVLPEPSIGEMVSRIEQLQQRRAPAPQPAAPALPEPSAPPPRQSQPQPAEAKDSRLFKWESDASGHIAWVEGAPRGILVGRPLSGSGVGLLERDVAARLVRHHPFADVPVASGGLFAGTWEATGRPAFDPATGRFVGYRGLARRTDQAAPADRKKREPDLDALREMVHEIKTPLNAIIGFAEIIDGQYLGPAHRLYRERAASIVAQARQLLAAVEDLDFAAKVRADRGAGGLNAGAGGAGGGLSDLIRPIAVEMEQCLAVYGGVLELDVSQDRDGCAVSPELAERLLRRLLLSLCKVVARGEALRIASSRRGGMCLLTIARPRLLDGYSEAQLVDPAFDPSGGDAAQSVGLGFALRLVRGLARVGGGSLIFDEHRISLELPAQGG